MISRIIKAEVCVICRSRRLRRIRLTEALIILGAKRKPNPIIVSLCTSLAVCKGISVGKKFSKHPTTYQLVNNLIFKLLLNLNIVSKIIQNPV